MSCLQRRKCIRELFKTRESDGFFKQIMLRANDPELFKHFFDLVTPLIKNEDTKFRKAISVAERLAVILRFLETGDSYV